MTMLLVLMLTSKGTAVPRASLVVVAATCGMFDIQLRELF
jgi:Na+/H+-dicarboxylate symporter